MWNDWQVAQLAPSLHFQEAIGLALCRSLLYGETAGDGEEVHQVDRFVHYASIMCFGQGLKTAAANVGVEGDEREVVLDDGAWTGHEGVEMGCLSFMCKVQGFCKERMRGVSNHPTVTEKLECKVPTTHATLA